MKMRLSSFGFAKDIDAIANAGFDCIEMHYREIVPMTDEEFNDLKRKLAGSPLTAEVVNNPLPLDKQIISPDFSIEEYRSHLELGAARAAELGARFCNFGNGKTRSLPVDASKSETDAAREKVCEAIKLICEVNAKHNITVIIEPLSPVVSNFILSIPEAIALAEMLSVDNLKTFIDLRWFVDEKRPYDEIIKYADQIQHIHIDNPIVPFPTRPIPRLTDDFDYAPFMEALKKICYKGIISCEANTFDDFEKDLSDLMKFFSHFDITSYRQ
ncbi:MAG: sugar phosphate isomerase/epimerase [Clostridiales bacterium]|nr:sugar phosphate isomerase/epimerase [Clostridiales bacterium]